MKYRYLFLTVLTLFGYGLPCPTMAGPSGRLVGGPCEYKEYSGQARITSIDKKESPGDRKGLSRERYEVRFSFEPHQVIKEKYVQVEGKRYLLLMTNSQYPGVNFLNKYGIEAGKTFDCCLKVITKGTCTPIIFDFPTLDRSDYAADVE